jgi:hypothetical protein
LPKDVTLDIYKREDIPPSWNTRFHILKLPVPPEVIYRFIVVPVKILVRFFGAV